MSSIHDVAREAGVSTATVSRALRGLPGVSEATRRRVDRIAHDLGYRPSPSAAGLAGGSTRTVAVVVPFVTRWYFAEVVDAVQRVLRPAGYDVLLHSLGGDPSMRRRVVERHVLTKRVDGVLMVGMAPAPAEIAALQGLGRPVVTLGVRAPWPAVLIDDAEVVRTAVGHLHDLGHRDIAYVGGMRDEGLDFSTPRVRLAAYRGELRRLELPTEPAWELEGRFTTDGGVAAGEELLRLRRRPTAVLCASDEMAIGLMHAVAGSLRVPEDLSVMGIDDHVMARFFALTTVRQDVALQGGRAAELLLSMLEPDPDGPVDGAGNGGPPVEVVPTEVVVRSTTAPPGPPLPVGPAGAVQRSE